MANITFSKKQFEREMGKLNEIMQEKISLFGTPLEEITDKELIVEIFPDRPDLLSFQGYKRSFLAFLGKKTGLKTYKLNKPEKNYEVKIDRSVEEIRPYTACAIVKGLKFSDEKIKEIIDIQEKLHNTLGRKRKKVAIGIYPLEKINLPITFKALEPDKIKFVPLESEREMSGLEILQRHPTGRDYAHLLAGKSKFPIFIDAEGKILSMPPIINSHLTGKIEEKTKDVFVECSGFDFNILNKCINIIITTLAEMGGKIYQMELKGLKNTKGRIITPDLTSEKKKISIENTNKLLGLNLNEKEIKNLLEKMGHNYSKGYVEIAPWRTDILHEVDLIEDVAIAYGYDNFIPEIPKISTIGEENQKEIIKRKISEILTGMDLIEVSNYHLTKKEDQFKKMGIQEKNDKKIIEIENSKTEYNILRKDLAHYIMKNFSENVDAEYPQRIFEIGTVFEGIVEKDYLALAITPGNFTEIKQILVYLSKMINIPMKLEESEEFPNYFIEGRTADIKIENQKIGYLGEIHPRILKNWRLKMPVALFEINLEEIFKRLL
jgi:phenylalanyl-tRNA synthetase beta chain